MPGTAASPARASASAANARSAFCEGSFAGLSRPVSVAMQAWSPIFGICPSASNACLRTSGLLSSSSAMSGGIAPACHGRRAHSAAA